VYQLRVIEQSGKSETKEVEVSVSDGGGRTLMPGLHDQHIHFSIFNPLSDGVTGLLAISAFYRNNPAALDEDCRIVTGVPEERFTR
jgi:hypothetical protein